MQWQTSSLTWHGQG